MAFFKLRKGGDESPAPPQPESVEALRRRARHRLIGAAVLVLLGVVGFPLLFDTQPRPVAVDIPIEIPDRDKARPLPAPAARSQAQASTPAAAPAQAAASTPAAPIAKAPVAAGRPVTAPASEPARAEARSDPKPEPKQEARPAKPETAPPALAAKPDKPEPPVAAKPPTPPDAARAQSLLEGKPVQARSQEAAEGRFVVQVGAFADVAKAREARLKVEKAGLKTYTHVAETRDGKRIRVRVGPFATRAEADKAAGRIKDLDLPAAILTL